ncbi:MAG: glycosyltransferase family 2 protein [Paracoccaceae bacterium]
MPASFDEDISTVSALEDAGENPIVSIIVVSYNTREMTLDCIRSVLDQTTCAYELAVYDNASSDGSAKAITTEFPGIQFIASDINHGFARANNIVAENLKGQYILLLNPDTIVLNGAIDTLVGFAKSNPNARIWGGRTLFSDRSLNPTNCWGEMTLWSLASQALGLTKVFRNSVFFNPEAYGGWQRDKVRKVDIVSGCFFLIEADLWRALDGFDLSFTMYGEEADLCLRARGLGAQPLVTPDAEIIHYVGASSKVRSAKLVMLLKAKVTLIRRHFPRWQQHLGVALLSFWPLSRLLASLALSRLTRSDRWYDTHSAWADVWDQRRDWAKGYGPSLLTSQTASVLKLRGRD